MSRFLVVSGAVLFLIGLFQGLAVDLVVNPRMALSAHLTAVQSGIAIMVAGAVAGLSALSTRWHSVMRWLVVVGMYTLWFGITMASLIGASEALPIAGEGHTASATGESVVKSLIVIGSIATIAGWGMFVLGLLRKT